MAGNLGFPSPMGVASGPMNFNNVVGMGVLPTPAPESVNNPNTVAGPYPYGQGMDFGLPDISTPRGWLQTYYPNHTDLQPGGKYSMDFGKTDIAPNRLPNLNYNTDTSTEKGWLQTYYPNHPDLQSGGKYASYDTSTEKGWLQTYFPHHADLQPGGKYGEVTDGLLAGGYDPGDMGDAATTQGHTDYMNAVRAAAAKEAAYQDRVRAEREAVDASIAANAATNNARNPMYDQQANFNQGLIAQNPTSVFDRWASFQSPQYQYY
jgi:hypothetical protein